MIQTGVYGVGSRSSARMKVSFLSVAISPRRRGNVVAGLRMASASERVQAQVGPSYLRRAALVYARTSSAAAPSDPIRNSSTARAHCRPFADRPDDERLAAPHVAGGENLRHRGRVEPVPSVSALTLPRASFATPSSSSRPLHGADETHREQHQIRLHLELACPGSRIASCRSRPSARRTARRSASRPCRPRLRSASSRPPSRAGSLPRARTRCAGCTGQYGHTAACPPRRAAAAGARTG